MYTEIRFVMDEHGIIYAQLPDGTCREVLVDVHESAWYGFLQIRNKYLEPEDEHA